MAPPHPTAIDPPPATTGATPPVAERLADIVVGHNLGTLPHATIEKARGCLADFLCCVIDAAEVSWSRQTLAYAGLSPRGPADIIGQKLALGATEAALVNGTLGHGLVREDMHVAACSHLGVVVWPTLIALAQAELSTEQQARADFLGCGVIGYEIGASVGRALFDADLASRIRPTGTIGAIGGAAAGARLLGLSLEETRSALALAANMASGLNEWPWAGGSEMTLHAGLAARSAVTAVLLARTGYFGSPSAIDGRAGLFAAYGRRDRAAEIAPFSRKEPEIMEVYWKPAPACNYVQTPCQVAATIADTLADAGIASTSIASVEIGSFPHAIQYPGCDYAGPFAGVLEAKMSLQYSVAAVLESGRIEEANYRVLDRPEVLRLAAVTTLVSDPAFTAAYPGAQGARVTVTLDDGRTVSADARDLVAVDSIGVAARLNATVTDRFGGERAEAMAEALAALGAGGSIEAVIAATRPATTGKGKTA